MLTEWLMLVAGVVVGGAVGWLLARSRAIESQAAATGLREQAEKLQRELDGLRTRLEEELQARAAAEASLEAARKNLEEQRQLLDDAKQRLSETFKSLSSDVLGSQS
jgi:uncharacterized membrane-anchored protein YhcB (DUF1043 family)